MAQTLPAFDSENAQQRFPAQPTRLPAGLSTRRKGHPFGDLPLPDPFKTFNYGTDFATYTAADWTVTAVGAGTAALSVTGDYGTLLITNAAADDNSVFLQHLAVVRTALVTPAVGKRLWFSCRLQVSDAVQSDVIAGLYNTNTTPIATPPTDGIYFRKDDGAATISFIVANGGVFTTVATGVSMVAATMIELAFFYDPRLSTLSYFINGVGAGGAAITNLPTAADALRLSFGLQNGEAVAKTALVDYAFVANDR